MTEQLKPCPFCGSDPRVRKRQDESLWSHNIVTWTAVGCPECEVEFDWPEGGESNAAEEWNRRAAEDDLRALALSLAEALERIRDGLRSDGRVWLPAPNPPPGMNKALVAGESARVFCETALSDPRLAQLRGK
jgi:Lar family restriction alleviation protein